MSQPDPTGRPDYDPRIGECSVCVHARQVPHPREGPVYWRCGMADKVKGFPKFPPLPVHHCSGFEEKAHE